jgi:hypothetical protein
MKIISFSLFLILSTVITFAQQPLFKFGEDVGFENVNFGKKVKGESIQWIQVNTEAETWKVKGKELVCAGQPIGVIRSEKKYENFIMHIEWKHMEAGGNSGTFVWSSAEPNDAGYPSGVEVQMLELDWVNQHIKDGVKPPIAYVHGELFGVDGVTLVPDNPRGERSKSVENRCKGKGEWNVYDVVCVDGTIKLSVNGKFVNGISKSSQKKGYICLESEGAEIHFRNMRIVEL